MITAFVIAGSIQVEAQQQTMAPAVRMRRALPDSLRQQRRANDTVQVPRDTARFKKTHAVDLDHAVKFSSKDSIVLFGRNDLRFYGESTVDYDDMKLNASHITMNMDSNVVHAVGVLDSIGDLVGTPVFTDNFRRSFLSHMASWWQIWGFVLRFLVAWVGLWPDFDK